MEGLFIGNSNSTKESPCKIVQELSLIAKGDGVEIMTKKVQPGNIVTLSPGEDEGSEGLMEFFYILDGTIEWERDEVKSIFNKGDYFHASGLKETAYFKTVTEVEMLYVSSQPVFHILSNEILELKAILHELEKKDLYTYDHDLRLCNYSTKIGEVLKLSMERFEKLYYGTLFHDIGKINTPIEILNKSGKLTDSEFDIIKEHPLEGKKILDETFLRNISNVILEHHERLDGSGYPNGLKGDEISLEAKIIAVIDSYDAMTSDRPYRNAIPATIAMQDLKRLVGIHYDEEIVKVFENILILDGEL